MIAYHDYVHIYTSSEITRDEIGLIDASATRKLLLFGYTIRHYECGVGSTGVCVCGVGK